MNKPFDLQKALAGEPVIRNKVGTNEYTPIVKVLHFPENTGLNQFLVFYNVNNNTCSEWLSDDFARKVLFMAPKKVTYYFASWENTVSEKPSRFTTNMYESEEKLLQTDRMCGAKGTDYLMHTIEIEE